MHNCYIENCLSSEVSHTKYLRLQLIINYVASYLGMNMFKELLILTKTGELHWIKTFHWCMICDCSECKIPLEVPRC